MIWLGLWASGVRQCRPARRSGRTRAAAHARPHPAPFRWLKCVLQRKCGIFTTKSRRASIGTSGHLLPRLDRRSCRASARKGICGRSPNRAGHKIVAVFKETASGADNVRPERAKVLALARASRDRRHPRHRAEPLGPAAPKTLSKRSAICTAGHQGFGPPLQAKSRP